MSEPDRSASLATLVVDFGSSDTFRLAAQAQTVRMLQTRRTRGSGASTMCGTAAALIHAVIHGVGG